MSATALGIAGLIASLIGSGVSVGSNISKSKKEEDYAKELELAQKLESQKLEKQRRKEAIANYLGVGKESSILNPYRYRVDMPSSPYTVGNDIASGLGGLASSYGSQLYNKYSGE